MQTGYTHLLQGVQTRRQMLKISAVAAAEALGLERASYYRLERGERRVYLDKALALARLLSCSVEQLAHEPSIEEQVEAFRKSKLVEQHLVEWPNDEPQLGSVVAAHVPMASPGAQMAGQPAVCSHGVQWPHPCPKCVHAAELMRQLPPDVAELLRDAEGDDA